MQELLKLLDKHKIDFIIDSSHIDIDDKEYVKEEICEIPNIFISKEKLEIQNIKEIENLAFIVPFEYTSTTKILMNCFKEHNLNVQVKKQIDITEVRINAAKIGIGIAYVMKEAVKNELERGELYEVKMPIQLPSSAINLIYVKNQLTQVDKEFIKKYLKSKK